MKRWIHTSCILAALGMICVGITICEGEISDAAAYLSHQNSVLNQAETGHNESHIDEDYSSPDEVEPDTTYQKVVKVKNYAEGACYVRVMAELSDSTIPVTIDYDTKYWTKKQSDGYYYYREALGSQEETQPLFTQVTTGDTGQNFQIIVYEETVQASGYSTPWEAFAGVQAK